MEFTINLASQPYQKVQRFLRRWRLLISGVALITVALLHGAAVACFSWRTTQRQVAELEREIGEQDGSKAQADAFLNRPENRQIRRRVEFLNAAIARKAFSWTEVFTDLEHIMPPRLRVTSIHPEVNEDSPLKVQLVVAGSTRDAAIELVRRLEQSSHFAGAQIDTERTLAAQPGQSDTIQYSISAIYIPSFARGAPPRQQDVSSDVASTHNELRSEALNAEH